MFAFLWPLVAFAALSLLPWYYQKVHPLRRFPGPPLARFTDLYQLWFLYNDVDKQPYRAAHERYGKVVRLGPNKLYFSSAQAARNIFNTRLDLRKSDYYTASAPVAEGRVVANLFASTDVVYHDKVRRAVQGIFNMSSVMHYESAIDDVVTRLLRQMHERFASKKGAVFDLSRWCRYFALDAISNVSYGKSYGFLERDEDINNMIREIEWDLTFQSFVGQAPWLDKFLTKNPIKLWLGRHGWFKHVALPVSHALRAQATRLAEAEDRAEKGQTERKADTADTEDILDKLIRVKEEQPDVMNDQEILKMGLAVVFAGADSTASMITATLYFLVNNPDKMSKLQDELVQEVSAIELAGECKYESFAKLQRLPYLDAVVKEAMRRFGVVRFTPERITPAGGMTIDGVRVPGGVIVGANPFPVQHDRTLFGEDVNDFRPERWLDAEPQRYKEMSAALMLFGQGKYKCLGENISQLEIFKVIAAIVRTFELSLSNQEDKWHWKHGLFVNIENVNVRISPRT